MNPDNLSLSEISTTIGVTLSALSNWQKRYDDFPQPIETFGRRRGYRLADVTVFIARHDLQSKMSPNKKSNPIWKSADLLRNHGLQDFELAIVIATFAELWASRKFLLTEIALSGKIPPQIWSTKTKQISGEKKMNELYPELPRAFRYVNEAIFKQIANIWLEDDRSDKESREQMCKDLFEFATRSSDKFHGANSTSLSLAKLMNRIGRGLEILDISTGLGAVLNTYAKEARSLTGQDVHPSSIQFQQLLEAINGESNRILNVNDSLGHYEDKWLNAFDVVICDPPLGKKNVADFYKPSDPRWTFFEQTNTQSEMDYWIQTVLAYLKESRKGELGYRGIVVTNDSWLFLAGEQAMRTALIRRGQVEAVVRLGKGLASWTSIALNLLILRKSEEPGTPVRLIDASEIGKVVRGQRTLSKSDIELISDVLNGKTVDNSANSNGTVFSRDVSLDEFLANDSILLPRRYRTIETKKEDPLSVLNEVESLFKIIENKLTALSESLRKDKMQLDIKEVSKVKPTESRYLTIGEIATNSAPFEILFKNRPQGAEWTRDDVLSMDIVICLVGPQIGESMMGTEFVSTGSNWSRIAQLRVIGNVLSTDYLKAWLSNGSFRAQVDRLAGGNVLRAISKKDLNRIIIPIPTLEVQEILGSIARQVEVLNKATQDVAELNNEMNKRLKTLLAVLLAVVATDDQRDSNAP